MTIRTILEVKGQEVVTASFEMPVEDVVALIADRKIGAVPVMRDGKVAGIFSERDLVRSLAKEGPVALTRPVSSAMTSPAFTVTSGSSTDDAMALMTNRRFRHLPVVDDGNLVGMVSIGDLVKDRIAHVEYEAQAMREYILSS